MKAHTALFEGGRRGGGAKKGALLFQSTIDIHIQNSKIIFQSTIDIHIQNSKIIFQSTIDIHIQNSKNQAAATALRVYGAKAAATCSIATKL